MIVRQGPLDGKPTTFANTWRRCPYRSFIGQQSSAPTRDERMVEMLSRMTQSFALIGGDLEPIDTDVLLALAEDVQAGGVLLVMADRADLRDRAKGLILAAIGPIAGRA